MPNFLLEVGTEELPADFVASAIAQWQRLIPNSLATAHLTPEAVALYATPRRLAVLLTGVPAQQADRHEEIKGPPVKAAYRDGEPTAAALGFAQKQGVTVADFTQRDTPKGEFIFIDKQIPGQPAPDILRDLIPQWITQLEGRRFMRWGDGELRFPRPIRWLVALWDEAVLPVVLVNGSEQIESDRTSWGHRVLHPQPVTIPHPAAYEATMAAAGVIVDPQERREAIIAQIETAAQSVQGEAIIPVDLLDEVINLVEAPQAVVGNFEAEFLKLPSEVITTVMVTHQRYFPIQTADGSLLPHFITIANGDPAKADLIATGNARVIRARLADGKFFYDADCDEPLEANLPQLETITFQADLGSMQIKVDRILDLTAEMCRQLELPASETATVERTALLCKADLVSQMVYEFPELQGIMGEKYALVSGESAAVARGIFEHYLPRGADDDLPQTLAGQLVGLGDRLDSLVSIFGLGLIPTGSSDPFALRRAANAVVNIIWDGNLELNLLDLLTQFSAAFVSGHPDYGSPLEALISFFVQRSRTLLQDELGIDYDLVNAVLGEEDPEYHSRALQDLLDLRDRAQFIQHLRNSENLDILYETVNRSTRLASKGKLPTDPLDPQEVIQPDLFEQESEQVLYTALCALVPQTEQAQAERDYQRLVDGLAAISPAVTRFFDGEDSVLVMAEDPAIQANRLNLLGLIRNHARILGDFGAIVK
ncbi:MAG: glycine--tRNA ligase subunit beta [Spirulina sp. DLM2.Bin59]|nr:MAG: glycine--tRNA ligase subunit beta [Spirulina sp. DLM2.Bin59]